MWRRRRQRTFSDFMAEQTCGCLVWLLVSGFGLVVALVLMDVRRQRLRYPNGKPIGEVAQHLRTAFLTGSGGLLLVGMVLALVALTMPRSSRDPAADSMLALGILSLLVGATVGYGSATSRFWREIQPPRPLLTPITTILIYRIVVPQATEWSPENNLALITQLVSAFPWCVFRVYADHERIEWQWLDLIGSTEVGTVERLIRSHFPHAQIHTSRYTPEAPTTPFFRYLGYYEQPNHFVAPMHYITDFRGVDPLTALLKAVDDLAPGERVILSLAVAGGASAVVPQGERFIYRSTFHPIQLITPAGAWDIVRKILTRTDRAERYSARDQHTFEDKLRERLYNAHFIIQVDSPVEQRIPELTLLIDSQLSNFTRMPYNGVRLISDLESHTAQMSTFPQVQGYNALAALYRALDDHSPQPRWIPRLILEPRELASLWHLPHEGFYSHKLNWARQVVEVTDDLLRVNHGLQLGTGWYNHRAVPVRIPYGDRVTHQMIVGKTGTGKSTLMHREIHQDIAAGYGVAVVDPHGDLVREVLTKSIPREREGDVVLLDLANESHPPPLNPLFSLTDYSATHRVVNLIERLFAGTQELARTSSFLRAALTLLEGEAYPTMRDVARIFMDDVYRETRLAQCTDPETQDLWDFQFNQAGDGKKREIADPILNRIRPFYANRYLYPALCHPDRLDFHRLMRERKIVLISLKVNALRVPDQEQRLVGALLVSALQLAGMQEQLAAPFYLYIDEVQDFVTTSLAEMLSEARKNRLSLTIAHQYLGQLEGKTLDAVMGNVGTTILFACGPDDKTRLATYTKPHFSGDQLANLDRFQAVVKMQLDGKSQPPFSLAAIPPLPNPAEAQARVERIRRRSVATYTPKTRDAVLAILNARYPRRPDTRLKGTNGAADSLDDVETFYEQ